MADRNWQLPVRQEEKEASPSFWSNAQRRYTQKLFGGVTCAEFNSEGSLLSVCSTNHRLLTRIPIDTGADAAAASDSLNGNAGGSSSGSSNIWNEQVPRACYSQRFRHDSKMIVQAVEQRVVVRSVDTAFERALEGHTRQVRDAMFLASQTVCSASDDTTVRLWDVPTQQEVLVVEGHSDYVRSLSRLSDHVFFSASYDGMIHLWDTRVETNGGAVKSIHVGKPIEQVLCLTPELGTGNDGASAGSNQNLVACAAGDIVSVYDFRNATSSRRGGADSATTVKAKLMSADSHHTKTVTSICYSRRTSTLISGGLDNRINFFSLDISSSGGKANSGGALIPMEQRKMNSGITAMAVDQECTHFVVGMVDGVVDIFSTAPAPEVQTREERVAADLESNLLEVRHHLASCRYHRALRAAFYTRHPSIVMTTVDELQRRCALHVALSGHNDRSVVHMVKFCVQYLGHPEWSKTCSTLLDLIFVIYAEAAASSPFLKRELTLAHGRLGEIAESMRGLQEAEAMMEMILGATDEEDVAEDAA